MGCCNDRLTCDIAFNAVMPLSRASTRGSYSRIEGVTAKYDVNHRIASPYHPKSSGQVELSNREKIDPAKYC